MKPLMFRRGLASVLAALSLVACDAVDAMKDGLTHSQAVSDQLEKTLGLKAFVGFDWNNGSLSSVNVTFQGIPQRANLDEISSVVKRAVVSEFKQSPKEIVVAFSFEP